MMAKKVFIELLRVLGHQSYITRGRFRLIRRFYDYDKTSARTFVVDFFGLRYKGSFASYIDWWVFFFGAYSAAELNFIRLVASQLRAMRGNVAMLDVGCNVGQHSLFASRIFDTVVAVEPYAEVRAKFSEKIELNSIRNVKILPVAFGSAAVDLPFYLPTSGNQGTGSFVQAGAANAPVQTIRVVRGDDHLNESDAPLRIDFIKIDVEGFEHDVLVGLRNTLIDSRPVILMELSPMSRQKFGSEGESALRTLLYDDHHIFELQSLSTDGRFRLAPFNYETSAEIVIVPRDVQPFLMQAGFGEQRLLKGKPSQIMSVDI